MKILLKRNSLAVVFCVGLFVLFPSEARANMNNDAIPCILLTGLLLVALAAMLAVVGIFLESVVAFVFGGLVPLRKAVLLLGCVALASSIAWIPIGLCRLGADWFYPRDPFPKGLEYFAAGVGVVVYLCAVWIFSLIVRKFPVSRTVRLRFRRIAFVVLLANVAAYVALEYRAAVIRASHGFTFTDNSAWTDSPPETLYYVAPNGSLCSIKTDGQGGRGLVPGPMEYYKYLPDSGIFIYTNEGRTIFMYRLQDSRLICCAATDQNHVTMKQIACSPDGGTLAYLNCIGTLYSPFELMLYDVESGETTKTGVVTPDRQRDPQIAWSADPSVLYLKTDGKLETITIGRDMSTSRKRVDPADIVLSEVYSPGHYIFGRDEFAGVSAVNWGGYNPVLDVTVYGESLPLYNAGVSSDGHLSPEEVCILPNGTEVVFSGWDTGGHCGLYLMDVYKKKIGKIAYGGQFMIVSDRYKRTIWNPKWDDRRAEEAIDTRPSGQPATKPAGR